MSTALCQLATRRQVPELIDTSWSRRSSADPRLRPEDIGLVLDDLPTFTCFGDIIAVAQLIRDIAKALDEVRGASHDYRAFVQQLHNTASVLDEAYRVIRDIADGSLQAAIIDEVQACYVDLDRATERTTGFEALLFSKTSHASGLHKLRDRLSRRSKMLQWHFQRSSDMNDWNRSFHNRCVRIQTLLSLYNIESTHDNAQTQLTTLRDDIAVLSRTNVHHLSDIGTDIRAAVVDASTTWVAHSDQQQSEVLRAIDAGTLATSTFIAESVRNMRDDIDSRLRITTQVSVHQALPSDKVSDSDPRWMTVAFPVLVSWVALFTVETEFAAPGTRWHSRTLWSAIFTLVLYSLWMGHFQRRSSIPLAVQYGKENSIIFIDFVGSHLPLPLELCGTMTDFREFLHLLFKKDQRKGWSFIRIGAYEMTEGTSATVLTASSWSSLVRVGAEIQLGALIRREGKEADTLVCPYCDVETFQTPTTPSDDWIFCMACRRSFQESTTRETVSVEYTSYPTSETSEELSLYSATDEAPTDAVPDPTSLSRALTVQTSTFTSSGNSRDESKESIVDFKLVRVLRVIVEYNGSQFSFTTTSRVLAEHGGEDQSLDVSIDTDDSASDSDDSSDFWNRRVQGPVTQATDRERRSTRLWGSTDDWFPPGSEERPREEPASVQHLAHKWIRGELIGKGNFGRVYLAMDAPSGEIIVAKQVEIPRIVSERGDEQRTNALEALMRECETLKNLDHPNVVHYMGFEKTFAIMSLFMEYVSFGSISSNLKKYEKFDESVTKSFTGQVLYGLEYIHSKGIIHRDIQGANILVDHRGTCKICDFGISTRVEDANERYSMMSMAGTVFWMAPEVVNPGQHGYNCKVDIWSLGCLVVEMWGGERPWYGHEAMEVVVTLYRDKRPPSLPESLVLDGAAEEFNKACFQIDPDKRPSAAELRKHPYLELPRHWEFAGFV
ncbi:unnamed protein product [Peniophora sp. CBMAI 1063]|nr:unnamed protein product [Peniophora sp. CBMAI 1063]